MVVVTWIELAKTLFLCLGSAVKMAIVWKVKPQKSTCNGPYPPSLQAMHIKHCIGKTMMASSQPKDGHFTENSIPKLLAAASGVLRGWLYQ